MLKKIDWLGIYFDYYGDILVRKWPWTKTIKSYYSINHGAEFDSLKDYWIFMGATAASVRMSKLKGISARDLAEEWARKESMHGPVVLLSDINPIVKSGKFWASVPNNKRNELLKDYCLLYPHDLDEAHSICKQMDPEFAGAEVYYISLLRYKNSDNYKQLD